MSVSNQELEMVTLTCYVGCLTRLEDAKEGEREYVSLIISLTMK